MTEALSNFINDAGWLAPIYYVLSFVLTALLPFIPTPLVGALGGAAFGVVPAILYGIIGLALGAFVALNLSRRIGRPLILRLVSPKAWAEWEALVGIRSLFLWGVIFFVLNVDFAVVAAGLSTLPLRQLWLTAMIARLPWLVASAWFGELVFVSDTVMLMALVGLVAGIVVFQKLRPRFRHWLVRWAPPLEAPDPTEPTEAPEARERR
ncbi:MAG: VTT domain-containing protein [Trueperaceae bacterium]|nr:VTT domain-containing protein [Trueperaceae bacterium]